jgi:hypothetical protein
VNRIFPIFLAFLLVFSLGGAKTVSAAIHPEDLEANALKVLDIFVGRQDGFALDQELTRVEAAVILLRLLGKESAALAEKRPHPFVDVPEWAGDHIGYLYQNALINGMSETHFGNSSVTFDQMMTMLMRALGYDDSVGDFTWSEASKKAVELSILTPRRYAVVLEGSSFTRGDLVVCVYGVLSAPEKNTQTTLLRGLINDSVLSEEQIRSTGHLELMQAAEISWPQSRHINLYQRFEIEPTASNGNVTITVSLADNYQNRQRVIGHKFSHTPERIYYLDGSLFAVFSMKNFTQKTTLVIETELEIFRYDHFTAQRLQFPIQLSGRDREKYTNSTDQIESADPTFSGVVFGGKDSSDYERLQAIVDYVLSHMESEIMDNNDDSALTAWQRGKGDCFGYGLVLAAYCRANDIPARLVVGVMPGAGLPGHAYCEVFLNELGWVPIDPVTIATGYATIEQIENNFVYLANVFQTDGPMGNADFYQWSGSGCSVNIIETFREAT